MPRHQPSDIAKTDLPQAASALPRHQNRGPFAGVVGAHPCRVVPVICSQHQQIPVPQLPQQLTNLGIKPLKRAGIARHIAPMPIKTVKLHKIRKRQAAVLGAFNQITKMPHQRLVRPFAHLVKTGHRKNVTDLSNGINTGTTVLHPVAQHRRGWLDRKITTVGGAGKTALRIPDEGTRDHPPDFHLMRDRGHVFA